MRCTSSRVAHYSRRTKRLLFLPMVTGAKGDNSGRVAARRVAIEQDARRRQFLVLKNRWLFRCAEGRSCSATRQNRYDRTLDARREPRPLIRTPVGAARCGACPVQNRPPGISSLRQRLPRSQLPPIRRRRNGCESSHPRQPWARSVTVTAGVIMRQSSFSTSTTTTRFDQRAIDLQDSHVVRPPKATVPSAQVPELTA
jgi:hypothetical protein